MSKKSFAALTSIHVLLFIAITNLGSTSLTWDRRDFKEMERRIMMVACVSV